MTVRLFSYLLDSSSLNNEYIRDYISLVLILNFQVDVGTETGDQDL